MVLVPGHEEAGEEDEGEEHDHGDAGVGEDDERHLQPRVLVPILGVEGCAQKHQLAEGVGRRAGGPFVALVFGLTGSEGRRGGVGGVGGSEWVEMVYWRGGLRIVVQNLGFLGDWVLETWCGV